MPIEKPVKFMVINSKFEFWIKFGYLLLLGRFGTRFPALSDAYDRSLVDTAMKAANELGYVGFLREGVYCAQVGPAFETPAECRFLNMVSKKILYVTRDANVLTES